MDFKIRRENENDYGITEKIVKAAFRNVEESDHKEHDLVSKIRQLDIFIPELSLLAVDGQGKDILGHILLSRIFINDHGERIETLALAPVSVLPEFQNMGIGSALIRTALEKATGLGFQSVVVLGHPEYYPKFGFKKSSYWQIKAAFDVPEEFLMAIGLRKGALEGVSGVIEYPSVFLE